MASLWDNLNTDFATRLRQLIADSGGRISLVSGYRSPQRQQQLWAQALAKYGSAKEAAKWVAPPEGTTPEAKGSAHTHGIAMDIGGDIQLAHTLAPKYGLYFPMSWEPWHIQPVGIANTQGMTTTPPDDVTGDPSESDPHAHVDKMMNDFSNLLGIGTTPGVGEATSAGVGEVTTAGVGETNANVGEATPNTAAQAVDDSPVRDPNADTGEAPMSGATTPVKGDAASNQALGKQLAAQYGWDGGDAWNALNQVIQSESGWIDQKNQGGGTAAGIGQNIHGYGPGYEQGNVQQQINWTLNYIKNRYGTPQNAWKHKLDTRGQYGNTSGWY